MAFKLLDGGEQVVEEVRQRLLAIAAQCICEGARKQQTRTAAASDSHHAASLPSAYLEVKLEVEHDDMVSSVAWSPDSLKLPLAVNTTS